MLPVSTIVLLLLRSAIIPKEKNHLMSNIDDMVKALGKECERLLTSETQPYTINYVQLEKLCLMNDVMKDIADDCGGKVDTVKLVPNLRHGCVTGTFRVFDTYGTVLERFVTAIGGISAMSIDIVGKDKVCVSATVPDIFVPIQ